MSRQRTKYVMEHELREARKRFNEIRERLRQSGSLDTSTVKTLKENYGRVKKQIDELEQELSTGG